MRRPNFITPACLLVPALFLAACAPDAGPERPDMSGEQVFMENCAACHGQQGRGPSLETLRALSADELRAAIRNHPTAGQLPERLTIDKLGELIEYLEDE